MYRGVHVVAIKELDEAGGASHAKVNLFGLKPAIRYGFILKT